MRTNYTVDSTQPVLIRSLCNLFVDSIVLLELGAREIATSSLEIS